MITNEKQHMWILTISWIETYKGSSELKMSSRETNGWTKITEVYDLLIIWKMLADENLFIQPST